MILNYHKPNFRHFGGRALNQQPSVELPGGLLEGPGRSTSAGAFVLESDDILILRNSCSAECFAGQIGRP